MTIQLRPYQERAIAQIRAAYARGRRAPCLVLPTGAGKTRIAAAIIASAIARGKHVAFLAHRTELINQTVEKLADAGVADVRIIQARRDHGRHDAPVTVGSIQTLTTDRWIGQLPSADLVIPDECHHVICDSWARVARAYPDARILGLTATPQRGDGRPLDVFDELVIGATVSELISLGYLVPSRTWAGPPTLKPGELALDPLAAYLRFGSSAPAIVFAANRAHARAVTERFVTAGIAADLVLGIGPAEARRAAIARFAAGETRVLDNVDVLTEGFDCPAAVVCILARRFRHVGAYLQAVGRVLRPAPGKREALILDLAGSAHEHGTPDVDRDYTLDGEGIARPTRLSFRQCPSCGSIFRAAPACPHCGTAIPVTPTKLARSVEAGLTELGSLRPPPKPMRPRAIDAGHPGTCAKCERWFPAGTPIWWAKGRRPQHQRCPVPALPPREVA